MAANVSNVSSHFRCQRCGLGDFEVGHLTRPDELHCLFCWEGGGQVVQLERWEQPEPDQARFRGALLAG
jgi:hypothetical protein